jgi:L-malate glycosyltransferase
MKAVHVASADLWGGAEAQVAALTGALSSRHGIDVSVILLNPDSRLGRELRLAGIPVVELDERQASTPGLFRQVHRLLSGMRPDIVHTHRQKEDIIGGGAAALGGIPSVRTVHGAPEPEIRGGARRNVLTTMDRWVARHLQSRVVAVSTDLMAKLEIQFPGASLTVIPNGISFAAVQSAATSAGFQLPPGSPGALKLGFFGRLVQIKRVDLLIQVANELAGMTDQPFDFYIVGEGPLQESLAALSQSGRASARVHFLGYQANSASVMRQMDAVMLVSDHEGLPMVLLEAAVLGVPIVARAVGGIPEFMASVDKGVLVDSADPKVIATQLLRANLGGMRTSPVTQANPALASYSIEVTSERYLALYKDVIAARRTGARK